MVFVEIVIYKIWWATPFTGLNRQRPWPQRSAATALFFSLDVKTTARIIKHFDVVLTDLATPTLSKHEQAS